MKRLVILFLIFFATIAVTPLLIGEKGYILISMGNYTIESSVVTALIFLVLAFILLMFSLKVFKGGWNMSFGAWNKFATRKKRKAEKDFNQGIAAFILKDFKNAEHLLVKSAPQLTDATAAYLLASDAAQAQKNEANSQYYLKCITEQSGLENASLETALVTIAQHVAIEQFEQAREIIDNYHRHLSHDFRLLALEIETCLAEKRYQTAIEFLAKARKEKLLAERVPNWETQAYTGQFNQIISEKDNNALHQYWDKLSRKEKAQDAVLFAYLQILAKHKMFEPLGKLVLPMLKMNTSAEFLVQIRLLPLAQLDSVVSKVQGFLQKQPQDTKWLSFLGFICLAGNNANMSVKAFHSLDSIADYQLSKSELLCYAQALMAEGNQVAANQVLCRHLA